MATLYLNFDDRTLARVERLAEARRTTVEAFLKDLLERLDESTVTTSPAPSADDPLLGLFADDPESIDAMLASVYENRQQRPAAVL